MKNCVVWDTDVNIQSIRERVNVLLKGCKCVTGCKHRVCGCRNKHAKCSEGYQCINCQNQHLPEEESDELAMVTIEEQMTTEDLYEMEET